VENLAAQRVGGRPLGSRPGAIAGSASHFFLLTFALSWTLWGALAVSGLSAMTVPGFGPTTWTIMRIVVGSGGSSAPLNLTPSARRLAHRGAATSAHVLLPGPPTLAWLLLRRPSDLDHKSTCS
jgi:hypothetical protein